MFFTTTQIWEKNERKKNKPKNKEHLQRDESNITIKYLEWCFAFHIWIMKKLFDISGNRLVRFGWEAFDEQTNATLMCLLNIKKQPTTAQFSFAQALEIVFIFPVPCSILARFTGNKILPPAPLTPCLSVRKPGLVVTVTLLGNQDAFWLVNGSQQWLFERCVVIHILHVSSQ